MSGPVNKLLANLTVCVLHFLSVSVSLLVEKKNTVGKVWLELFTDSLKPLHKLHNRLFFLSRRKAQRQCWHGEFFSAWPPGGVVVLRIRNSAMLSGQRPWFCSLICVLFLVCRNCFLFFFAANSSSATCEVSKPNIDGFLCINVSIHSQRDLMLMYTVFKLQLLTY